MAEFIEGLKSSLKMDEMAGNFASKFNSAKEYVQQKQQAALGMSPMKTMRDKIANMMPADATQFSSYLSPTTWTKYFPAAKGNKQSPIDLVSTCCQHDERLGDFSFQYYPSDCMELRNTGASWQILAKGDARSVITAPHLPGTYKLKQIHCHWGSEPTNGSEHFVNGMGYAAEIHLVHYNVKYGSFEEAIKHSDGLAVLGVFLQEYNEDNPILESLIRVISKIPYKADVISLPDGFEFKALIPSSREYWTYEGSLTTPPCNECVIWTVFRKPLHISKKQLDVFRQLYAVTSDEHERNPQYLVNNVRPPQALNNRTIRCSFRF